MTTRFVGMKEFRKNLSTYAKNAKKYNIRYIVFRKNVPLLEVHIVDEKEIAQARLAEEIHEAREQVEMGEVYTQEEIMKEFGLL